MKILSYKFFNKTSEVEDYSKMYRKINFKTSYPANFNRLKIFKYLLKKYRPKKIIDAGIMRQIREG